MTRSIGFLVRGALISGAVSLASVTPSRAQHFPPDSAVEAILRSRIEEGRGVGFVVGMVEADGSRRVVSYGDPGPGARALAAESVFEIGSITKAFTGILLADMVGRGEVALEDPVALYLPEEVTVPSRNGREITLEDLSAQRSGLPRLPDNLIMPDRTNPYAAYTVELMYDFLGRYELPRDVGSLYEYSNLGVGLLGHALARRLDMTYGEAVEERILGPLGMDMTGIQLTPSMQVWLALGHDQQGEVASNWDFPTLAGAGALRSNMDDMLSFMEANLGVAETSLEEAMRLSHVPRQEAGAGMRIGLNWHIMTVGDAEIVWHNGGTGGYRTLMGFDAVSGIGVVVLTNSSHNSDDIGLHLLNAGVTLTPAPRERVAIVLPRDVLEEYVGEYEVNAEVSLTVRLEDGVLLVQAPGEQPFPVLPESETEFFLQAMDLQLTFVKDRTGRVTGLQLHSAGQSTPARKVR